MHINADNQEAQISIKNYLDNRGAFDKAVLEFAIFYYREMINENAMIQVPLKKDAIGNYAQYPLTIIDGVGKIGIGDFARNISFKKEVVETETTTKNRNPHLLMRDEYDGSCCQQIEPLVMMFPHHTELIIELFKKKQWFGDQYFIKDGKVVVPDVLREIRDKQIALIENSLRVPNG